LKTKKEKIAIGDKCRSFTRVMPTDDTDHAEIGEIIYSVRTLFYKLCSIRDKMYLTSGQFEKLHTNALIKKCGIQRVNLNLLF